MEQGLVVTHLQKHSQAARRTCKIKELLRKRRLCSFQPNKKCPEKPHGERSRTTPPKKEGGDFLGFFYKNSTRKPCQGRFEVCDKGILVAWPILKNTPHVS